jgi:hypothetical protein
MTDATPTHSLDPPPPHSQQTSARNYSGSWLDWVKREEKSGAAGENED